MACSWFGSASSSGQTAFAGFNTVGQYTNNFNAWNDNGSGANAGVYCFQENTTDGVGGSGGVSVYQSTDTTATYHGSSWNFAGKGTTIIVSTLVYAAGGNSADKIQLGIINSTNNGLNANAGVAFESFRLIPASTSSWNVFEQNRTGNSNVTSAALGAVSITAGHWYKFVVSLTNTSGAGGNLGASCCLFDYGTNGLIPGANLVTFSTATNHAAQDVATNASVWPALRITANAAANAWDNFLVFQSNSTPVFTLSLVNSNLVLGSPATFNALADGPGTIAYDWYTNKILAAASSGSSYAVPQVIAGLTNLMVVAKNSNGSTTNSATLTPVVAGMPQIASVPAANVQTLSATLGGQIL